MAYRHYINELKFLLAQVAQQDAANFAVGAIRNVGFYQRQLEGLRTFQEVMQWVRDHRWSSAHFRRRAMGLVRHIQETMQANARYNYVRKGGWQHWR